MGIEVYAGKGGSAADSVKEKVSLPKDREYSHTFMEIVVGPSLSETLLQMARGGRYCSCLPTSADMASRLLMKLNVLEYMEKSGHAGLAGSTKLRKEAEDLLSSLVLAQRDDGSFPWIRQASASPLAAAQALKAMALAEKMGFHVPEKSLVTAAAQVDKAMRQLKDGEKAFYLHALSFYKKPDFTFLNSLFRSRNTLSNHGVALLALAFQRSGHTTNAAELAKILIARGAGAEAPWLDKRKAAPDEGIVPWMSSNVMQVAHATLAVALSEPGHPLVKKGIDYLLKQSGYYRRTGPSHAAAVAALSDYLGRASLADSRFKLGITVNGRSVKSLDVDGAHPVTVIPVPEGIVKAKDNVVAFDFKGRGQYTWSVRLSGFTRQMEPRRYRTESPIYIDRSYTMAPLEYKGRPIGSGFGTVVLPKDYKQWKHDLEEINRGETGRVMLQWWSDFSRGRGGEHPLVITDTLPAGCTVVETGISGRYDHYELGAGTITFYVSRGSGSVSYPLYAAYPGEYGTLPAVVNSVYDPSIFNNTKTFDLPLRKRDAARQVAYKMTPDELYNLGVANFNDEKHKAAQEYLEEYLTKYTPRDKNLVDAASKLFRIAYDNGDDVRLVRYFELLRERAPSLVLTFQETARVGTAYRARGEHEQALQIFRAAAGASFGREAQVAAALEREGEVAGSLLFLASLCRTYPDLPEIERAFFALSQTVLGKAGPAGGRSGVPKLTRGQVMTAGVKLLVDFLATYPENPIAGEAAYALVSTLLDMERAKGVVRLSPIFRERWPKSRFCQSLQYSEAYALFEMGRYGEARGLLDAVAESDPKKLDREGRDNRDLAIYILGQIEHAGGKIADALKLYEQVKKKFADAAEAIDYFMRRSVSLPEVSTFRSGEKVKVELKYRNVPKVTLAVYKVDLMKLYLMRKNLNNITDINLAGIGPTVLEEVELGDGKDYKEKKKELSLPFGEKGAYLVVVQGGSVGCTGMILVTDLNLEVQEDTASGRVRVNVKDQETGTFQKNIYVKVIGSGDKTFRTGYTDLRGVFTADDIHGESTVIAERSGEYAFHRGRLALQSAPSQRRVQQQELQEGKFRYDSRNRALQNVFSQNKAIQQSGKQIMDQIYQEDVQGVKIK